MSLVGLDNRGQFLIYFTLRYLTEFMIVDGRNESLKFLLKFYVKLLDGWTWKVEQGFEL